MMFLRPKTSEKLAFATLRLSMALVLAFVSIIVIYITVNGYSALSLDFITQMPMKRMTQGGIYPAIVGSLMLIGLSMAFAIPLGILSAVYLNEYSTPGRASWAIEMAINNLAGTPSVVFGLFGLALFVKYFGFGASILSASLTLALLIVPVIIRASKEALMTVPGMMTGIILSIGRVAGETAPILLTGAAYFLPRIPDSVFSQFMALPYHLFVLATSGTSITQTRPIQYGTALILLLIVVMMNSIAVLIRRHYRNKLNR
jgi:phosphate transport system permease protein